MAGDAKKGEGGSAALTPYGIGSLSVADAPGLPLGTGVAPGRDVLERGSRSSSVSTNGRTVPVTVTRASLWHAFWGLGEADRGGWPDGAWLRARR